MLRGALRQSCYIGDARFVSLVKHTGNGEFSRESIMKKLPTLGTGIALVACLLQAPMAIAQDTHEQGEVPTFFGVPIDGEKKEESKESDTTVPTPSKRKTESPKENQQRPSNPKIQPKPKPETPSIPDTNFEITDKLTAKQREVAKYARGLINQGKPNAAMKAIKQLQSNIKDESKAKHPVPEGLIAQLANKEKRYDLALTYAGPFTVDRDKYGDDRFNCYLQAGYAFLGLDAPDEAARLFDFVMGKENGGNLRHQILAAEGLAATQVAMKQPCKALGTIDFAIHNAKARNAKDRYEGNEKSLADLLKRLQSLKSHVKYLCDTSRFGPDYMAFKAADVLRHDGKYLGAFKAFRALTDEFPDSPYKDASELYVGECLMRLGAIKQAEVHLREFVKQEPGGLHRGEALLMLGKIAIDMRADREASHEHFAKLQEWIAYLRRHPGNTAWPDVMPAAKRLVEPSKVEKKLDFWGNVVPVQIKPGQLVNRLTTQWYMDDLEERAMKYIGFLHMADGEVEKAQVAFERLLELDPEIRKLEAGGEWNDYRRLMFAVEHGYLVAYPEELDLYNDKLRFVVMLGDFYYVTERFGEAEDLFTGLLEGKYGKLSSKQLDYANLAKANAVCWRRGRDAALPYFEAVLEKKDNTLSEYRAALASSLIRIQHKEIESQKVALKTLQGLVKTEADNEFVHGARVTLARVYMSNGKADKAIELLEQMPKSAQAYKTMADYYVKQWSPPANQEPRPTK